MGKSSSSKVQVNEYYMSMHLGIASTIDALLEIIVGEKLAWRGEVTSEGVIAINQKSLFGGVKKEGGVSGYAYFLPGGPLQTIPNQFASRLGQTTATCPGFRGISSVFFVGRFDANTSWVPVPGTGSGPGGGGGSGGGGGGSPTGWDDPGGNACPAPWVRITLANDRRDGPGVEIRADEIRPGMFVWTMQERTLEWGAFEVEAASIHPARERWLLDTEDGRRVVASDDHRVYSNDWRRIQDLQEGDSLWGDAPTKVRQTRYYDHGNVVRISVRDARTFLMDGILSHNLKPATEVDR